MTDEERQKLCNALRSPNRFHGPEADIAKEAADEIERLRLGWEQAERERNEARDMCARYADRIYYVGPEITHD